MSEGQLFWELKKQINACLAVTTAKAVRTAFIKQGAVLASEC